MNTTRQRNPAQERTRSNSQSQHKSRQSKYNHNLRNMKCFLQLSITRSLITSTPPPKGEHTYILLAHVATTAPCVTKHKITHFLVCDQFFGSHSSSGPLNCTIVIFSPGAAVPATPSPS